MSLILSAYKFVRAESRWRIPVRCGRTYRSNQLLAIFALRGPLLLESLAQADLGDGLVADHLLQLRDGQPLHRLAQGLEDTSLVATMGCDLLALRLENGFFSVNLLVRDHRSRGEAIRRGLDVGPWRGGEGFRGQDGVGFGEGVEYFAVDVPDGTAVRGCHAAKLLFYDPVIDLVERRKESCDFESQFGSCTSMRQKFGRLECQTPARQKWQG
jgi:hypothetical protein